VKVKRPNGIAREPREPRGPEPVQSRFVVTVVVKRSNGEPADCAGLTWQFDSYSQADRHRVLLCEAFRFGRTNGKPYRSYPFVSIFDRKTEKRYDYTV
jgi:hypothetical protein